MTKVRWNLMLLGAACVVWACVLCTELFPAFFWWVAPAIALGSISTMVLCGALDAGPFARPLLALVPPGLVMPYVAITALPDPAFGYLPLLVFLVPALAVSAIWLLVAYVVEARASSAWSIGRKDGG